MNNIENFNKYQDQLRKSHYNLEYKISIIKLHNLIKLRIIEISKNFENPVEVLNINLTNLENLFPINDKDLASNKILVDNINLNIHDFAITILKIKKKYDIIFFQLPLGIKEPNGNDTFHKVVEKNLKKFGAPHETIFHIHNWFNLINLMELRKLLDLGYGVVFTLHDQRLFTGGCHYSLNCSKFKINFQPR